MLQYIYTGKITIFREEEQAFKHLLNQMQIGSHTKSLNNDSTSISSSGVVLKELSKLNFQPETVQQKQQQKLDGMPSTREMSIPSKKEKHNAAKQSRRLPIYPSRPLQLTKAEVTLINPLNEKHGDFMRNPDVVRSGYIVEKSGSKFSLLTEANADTSGNLMDYPRMADRLGIYFDPQLFNVTILIIINIL